MTRALKVTMTAYGVGGLLFGLAYLFFPGQAIAAQAPEAEASAYLVATKAALGASLVTVGSFVAIAGRDPIKHILWVRFAIVFALLFLAVALFSGIVLFAELSQAIVGIAIHGVFAAALLACYPWRTHRRGEWATS